jgi:hypothetical protein
MPYADPSGRVAQLLEQLARRLDCAHDIALATQDQMAHASTADIEASIARLETVAQEFKLLFEEYERLPATTESTPRVDAAQNQFRDSVARVARSSAICGGLLERMIVVSRRRLDLLNHATDGTYSSQGRTTEFDARGLRLKERV